MVRYVAVLALGPLAILQAQTKNLTIAGSVFDSVSMRPLRGATIEAVDASAPTTSTVFRAHSDSTGKFEITGVPSGKYLVGFSHALLDSLSIETPPRTIDVAAAVRGVRLAVPSLATIGTALCKGVPPGDSTGIVFGRTYGARSLTPASGVSVDIWWIDLVIGSSGLRQRLSKSTTSTTAEGLFVFCAVPANAEVALQARTAIDSTAAVGLTFASRGAYRRDLFVGDGAPAGGQSDVVVRGAVHGVGGRPMRGASVRISGLPTSTTTSDNGRFELRAPPVGTREAEIRLIGFVPEKRIVDLRAGDMPSLDVELRTIQQIMDTVKVRATRIYDADSRGFSLRRRSAIGSFYSREDVERRKPRDLTELLRQTSGVFIEDDPMGDIITMRSSSLAAPRCIPSIFIDGHRLDDLGARDLTMMVKPEDLEGMEVYATAERTPVEFTTLQGCGTIVIWTRSRMQKR